jgi:riboflavin synthase
MFTGIIESVGKVVGIERGAGSVRLTVSAGKVAEDVGLGDSVAVNGVCLTVVEFAPPLLTFDAVHETLRRTSLGELRPGSLVNLERALPVGGRLGGHLVQGHVDCTGRIASIRPSGDSWMVYVDVAPEFLRTMVSKGSVALDGISLTIVEAADRTFSVSVIPHTWAHTTLAEKRAGDMVNVECDILGKYVEKLLGGWIAGGGSMSDLAGRGHGVTMELLERSGYVGAEEDRW